jgi:hypothetical protein
MAALAVGLAIAVLVFLLSGGRVFFLPFLFCPSASGASAGGAAPERLSANMRSMGAEGSSYGAFKRALRSRNLTLALAEARHLPRINLADALALLLLIRDTAPDTYGRAAGRWLGRYCAETPSVDLDQAALVLGALAALRADDPRPGALALVALVASHGERQLDAIVRRWLAVR